MTVTFRFASLVCFSFGASGLRRHSKRDGSTESDELVRGSESEVCSQLLNLTVRNIQVGPAAHKVCQAWPEDRWGEFPIKQAKRAKELFQLGFGEGGLWDQMKALAAERSGSTKFCWKALKSREEATCTDTNCGTTTTTTCFENHVAWEPTNMAGQGKTKEPTEYWCQKRCQLTAGCKHFSYWTVGDACHLQNTSAKRTKKLRNTWAGPPICSGHASSLAQREDSSSGANATAGVATESTESLIRHRRREDRRRISNVLRRRRSSLPSGCQQFINDQCYGSCPRGYEPTKLLKIFAPTCKTQCSQSKHPFRCGFGCARDAKSCKQVVMEQVSQVINAVAQSVAYLTGNQAVHKVAEKIVQLVEFILSSMWMLMQLGRDMWKAYKESESIASFLSVFVAFVMENAEQIQQNVETLLSLFGEVIEFWAEMLDEGFNVREAPLKSIANAFGKYGAEILESAAGLVRAFIYPKCEVA